MPFSKHSAVNKYAAVNKMSLSETPSVGKGLNTVNSTKGTLR